jgi:hypothetical protein
VIAWRKNVAVRGIGLAVLVGLWLFNAGLFNATAARAQNTVELAMATPEKSDIERCLHPPAAAAALVVAACTAAIDDGLSGPDRALALAKRGNARQSLGDGMGARSRPPAGGRPV